MQPLQHTRSAAGPASTSSPASLPHRTRPHRAAAQHAHHAVRARKAAVVAQASLYDATSAGRLTEGDLGLLVEAAQLSDSSAGLTQPHPNAACILVGPDGRRLTSAYQRAQGTTAAEVQAVSAAGEAARGSTAYINLESGDCHGDSAAVEALLAGGVSRVVVGLRHPLSHLRGRAVAALRGRGVAVDVLGEVPVEAEDPEASEQAALLPVYSANDALLHRAALGLPLSVLKYAMTLDGKIATAMGHSAWVSSPASRAMVFDQRARSDAVIVGGNTVRRDNPRLTTRQEGGHMPVRIVMSRTLDLPEDANLWDISTAPTIVMTQRGARQRFQAVLRDHGVEVVEFDFLTPDQVARYCYERGFLQCFWECGGTLAAPSISAGVIHKVMAFIAPKIIGGTRAPTPVGELGFVEMTQAVELSETNWRQVGPDLMIVGYLPPSGGPVALEGVISAAASNSASTSSTDGGASSSSAANASSSSSRGSSSNSGSSNGTSPSAPTGAAAAAAARATANGAAVQTARRRRPSNAARTAAANAPRIINFYKAWDRWGSLSNFSPHPITMPDPSTPGGATRTWPSVEHYYQASKFAGSDHPDAKALVEAIALAPSPEEAARIGRRNERARPELLRPDWSTRKLDVMYGALQAKFSAHAGPRAMLLETSGATSLAAGADAHLGGSTPAAAAVSAVASSSSGNNNGSVAVAEHPAATLAAARPAAPSARNGPYHLVESSPHDYFWGSGFDRSGHNWLGRLLMKLRDELRQAEAASQASLLLNGAGATLAAAAAAARAAASAN